jgi:hypothetical protein
VFFHIRNPLLVSQNCLQSRLQVFLNESGPHWHLLGEVTRHSSHHSFHARWGDSSHTGERTHHAGSWSHHGGHHGVDHGVDAHGDRHLVGRSPIIFATVGLTLFFYFFLGLFGLLFSQLDLAKGFGIDVDVEDGERALLLVELVDFAAVRGVVDQEIAAFFFVAQVNPTDVGVVVDHWVDVDLDNVLVDLPEALDQIFLELLLTQLLWLGKSLGDEREVRVILLHVEEESNFAQFIILHTDANLFIVIEGYVGAFKLEESAREHFVGLILNVLRINDLFLLHNDRSVAGGCVGNECLQDLIDGLFSVVLENVLLLAVQVVAHKVHDVEGHLGSFVLHVLEDLNSDLLEVLGQFFIFVFRDGIFSNETEESSGFKFGSGSAGVAGVEFARAHFLGSFKEFALVILGESFEVILLHLMFSEGEVVVDVEGTDKDLLNEVGLVVEGLGLVMIDKFDLDDAIPAVDRILFHVGLFLSVFEEHVHHLVLDGLFHVLDNHLFAVLQLLLHRLLTHPC